MKSDYAGIWLAPGARRLLGGALARALPECGTVLDVGCGAASWLWLANLQPTGIDQDPAAVARFSARGPAAVGEAVLLPFAAASFDTVVSIGLLHHLDDTGVGMALGEMRRVARRRILVFDAVVPRAGWRRPLAWSIRKLDRGRWMRSEAQLTSALQAHGVWRTHRLTYSWTGLEGLLSVLTFDAQRAD